MHKDVCFERMALRTGVFGVWAGRVGTAGLSIHDVVTKCNELALWCRGEKMGEI
jgi:hypothetical protein